MSEIYQNAACTVCFVGPRLKTMSAAYSMLVELAHEAKTLEAPVYEEMDKLPAFVNHLRVRPVKMKLFGKYAGDSTIVGMAGCE